MKKTTTAILAALFSMTALSTPALANDAVRIGVGILGLVINEAAKGSNKGNARRPGKGDTLIGRVGEEPRRNNGGRARNKGTQAAAAAAVALATLPETGPFPEARPSDEEIAQLLSGPTPSIDGVDPDATTAAIADSSAEQPAVSAGVEEFAQKSFPVMEPITDTFEDGSDGSELLVDEPQQATLGDRSVDFGTVWNRAKTAGTLFDEHMVAWGDFSAETIQRIDNSTAGGMARSEAIVAHTDLAAPGKSKVQAAAELAQRGASEKAWADAQARAQAAVDAESKRIADARAAELKAREFAEAEAALKAQAEAERLKLEAAYPALARKTAPVAEVPSVTEKAASTVPVAVDTQATTSSTTTDLQPEPKKASANLDL